MNELAGASVAPQNAPAEAAPSIPSPFVDIVEGKVPGVTLPPINDGQMSPAQEFVVSNFNALMDAGLDYYEFEDTAESVIFNPQKISEQQLKEAREAGTLGELLPLASDLAPLGQPADAGAAPQGPAPSASPAPLAGMTVAPNKSMETARLRNVAPAPKNAPNPVPNQLGRRAI